MFQTMFSNIGRNEKVDPLKPWEIEISVFLDVSDHFHHYQKHPEVPVFENRSAVVSQNKCKVPKYMH